MKEPEKEIAAAAKWLAHEADRLRFGELVVRLVLHAGRVSRVERTITEKSQPANGEAKS
jgi:hypothetical protein